jgi:nucleotide-binding universal stress UspA family protein
MTPAAIAVGADAEPGSRAALAWALAECRNRSTDLLLVHAPDAADEELAASGRGDTGAAVARAVLAAHREVVQDADADVAVTAVLSDQRPADALIEASKDVELLVLGSHGIAGFAESALGSIAHRVAVHAHCPVVIVPPGSPAPRRARLQRIVVGVSPTRAGGEALRFAAAEARRNGATLVLVRSSAGRDAAGADAPLAEARAELGRGGPQLPVETITAAEDPATALLAAARGGDLVVLGCHHSDDPWNSRLGAVPTGVLMAAECPVVLVGQVH